MFLEFYGLREQPFGVTPNPRYLYHSPIHREALASLIYGIEADLGFAALIAEPGMGKTTLLFYLLEKFRETARTALIFQTLCSPVELLCYLASELEIPTTDADPVVLNERIKDVLIREAQAGRRVIVIIDEAQNLDEPVLETIRLLSDFETQNFKLLHIILAGQLQLAEKLARPCMAQLLQRVSMLNRLNPLTLEETKNYIEYRLGVAGYRGAKLFGDDAVQLIAEMSGGVPRNINRICFNALSIGCALGKQRIDTAVVQEVGNDLDIGDLLFKKGAISDEPQQKQPGVRSTPVAHSAAESITEPEGAASRLKNTTEKPAARQWPAFPVRTSQRTGSSTAEAKLPADRPPASPRPSATRPSPSLNKNASIPPLTSAQPKLATHPITAPVSPVPNVVRAARAPQSQTGAQGVSSRRAALALVSVLSAIIALAGWTLWVKAPAHEVVSPVQASSSPQTYGQEVDLPVPDNGPRISDAIERGRSAARNSQADLQKNSVRVSAKRAAGSSSEPISGSGATVVDFVPQGSSAAKSRAISAALIRKVQPVYPNEARRSGIQGSVTVAAVIGVDGKPRNVRAVNGNPILARAATDAISQWLYQPYFVNGRPVEVETEVVVDFALR